MNLNGANSKQAKKKFQTTANGSRLATPVGGTLTSRKPDFIIIDEPLKPDEAASQIRRRAVNAWYDHTLYSRLLQQFQITGEQRNSPVGHGRK
ncbi:MAG: hypothetical protein WBZ14_07200 [Terriglobales bacterium]|jgi:hypothetical protein